MKCSECESTNHDAAMYPGTSPQSVKAPLLSNIILKWMTLERSVTEVCGPGQWSCSCSKIYPNGSKQRTINRSMIRTISHWLVQSFPRCSVWRAGHVHTILKHALVLNKLLVRRQKSFRLSDWMAKLSSLFFCSLNLLRTQTI